ncbi:MAG TPA: TonB-dependent receptor [Longimicrobiales bacterium]
MGSKLKVWLHAAFAVLLLGAAPAWGQNGTITGRVTSQDGARPLVSAVVEAVAADGRTAARSTTNATGHFSLTVPAGTYDVMVTVLGHRDARVAGVTVPAGGSVSRDFTLEVVPFQLEQVVVTGTGSVDPKRASETPASVSTVSERDVREQPAVTPVDHVRSAPAVDVIESGVQSRNVVVRGFNNIFSGALLTLTDHRIAGVPSLRVNFLQFVPQSDEDIGRMEVVLGPASALYGPNTANGVLHILTKSPFEEQRTTLTLAGGERDLFHGTFRTSHTLSDRFGVKLSGQYMRAEEWFYRDTGEDSIRAIVDAGGGAVLFPPTMPQAEVTRRSALIANRDFDLSRFSGDLRADWAATDRLTAVFSAGLTNTNSIELTGIGAAQVVDWKYSYAQARATYGNLFAQTYLNMSNAGDTYLLRNGSPITDKSRVWVSQLQHRLNLGTWQNFAYGVDYVRTIPVTEQTINGRNEDNDTYDEIGGYLQSETAVHRMFDIVLAGRVDKHSELPDPIFSPRAALVFKPTQDHNFRATYNRAFSTPTSLNLFLDIDAGPLGALGPFGFRAHAQAPGRAGINLHASDGSVQIRTPFGTTGTPTDLRPVTAADIYEYQVNAITAAASLPATLRAYMLSLRADPAFGGIPVIALDPLTSNAELFSPTAVRDIAGIEESTTSTFEVGYKGMIGGRLMLAADAWWSNQKNFTSPLIAATPLVMMSPQQLVPFLVPRLSAAFQAQGMPQAQADAQAQAIATGMAQLPGGIVSSAAVSPQGPALVLTYVNFGEVDLSGIDLAATAILSDSWQLGVTGSLVSDDFFRLPLGQTETVVALNAPKKKGSASLTYRNLGLGLNGQVRVRYTDEFPANSAGYVGLSCVDATLEGECVKSYTLVDFLAGYELPVPGASLQLSISNLFDEDYQSFIGVPVIGRMAILRLRYSF